MQIAKQETNELLKRLPVALQYHFYVLQKIECGLKEGRVCMEEEVEKMMANWFEK